MISQTILFGLDGRGSLFGGRRSNDQELRFLGFLYPNAMKIPPSVFSIGRPEEVLSRDGKIFYPKQKVLSKHKQEKCACKQLSAHIWDALSIWWKQAMPALAMDRPMIVMEEIPEDLLHCR